ncbi:MAG TPA: FAD-dependent oxidoreductase [Candidatus Dormibacteraeota bacterium]|nr:FAD-dependent oxidoreductase [Candidatus Dormibacteraeota bacterium]
MILPGDAAYDRNRAVWNGVIDRRPAAVLRCASAEDVVAAVRCAREADLEIAVKCGGHNAAGLSVTDGGVMIDLSPMSHVGIDPRRRKAWAGGGSLLGNLDRAAQHHGLATTAGNVSHTGVGGLTLGGGMGWLARQFGLACDNVEAYTVVTAEGCMVRATATENPDLFWGVRGGGGNFGIVTEFEFRLHPVTGGALLVELVFDAADARNPLRAWRDMLAGAPRQATLIASATTSEKRPVVSVGYV